MIYKTVPDGLEIIGAALFPWFDNLRAEVVAPILDKYDLHSNELDPEKWYDAKIFDELHAEIYRTQGGSEAFVAIGKATGDLLINPDQIQSTEWFLEQGLNMMMTGNFRNMPDGYGINHKNLGPSHYYIINQIAAPDDLIYGFLWSALGKLVPKPSRFVLKPIKNYNPSELSVGATFEVKWN